MKNYKRRKKPKKYVGRLFQYLAQPTIHHIIPTSRGGSNSEKNKIKISRLHHNAWHLLFENKTPEEIIELIKQKSVKEILQNKKNRILAWQIIFGYWETSIEEKIAIIKKKWSKKEG